MKNNRQRAPEQAGSAEWPTGEFEQIQQISHRFPPAFMILCNLLEVTPQRLLDNFANDLVAATGHGATEQASHCLHDYFVERRYGFPRYSADKLREIFKDLLAMRRVFPQDDDEMIKIYGCWRDKHYSYLHNKWVAAGLDI